MEEILLDSDSEKSGREDETQHKSDSFNLDDDLYGFNFNNEDYPPINYKTILKINETKNESEPEDKIEEFVTPLKPLKEKVSSDEEENDILFENSYMSDDSKKRKVSPGVKSSFINTKSHLQTDKTNYGFERKQKSSEENMLQTKQSKPLKKVDKEKLREEKKVEQLRQKALKKVLLENHKNLKPEENIKFLKVHVDNEIINSFKEGNILSVLQQHSLQYEVNAHVKSNTIFWSKKKVEKVVDNSGNISEKTEAKEESELLYVLDWQQTVDLVHKKELLTHLETIKSVFVGKRLTLIIFGIENYFNFKKNKKTKNMKAEINEKKVSKLKPEERVYEGAPSISKSDLEFALSDLQLRGKHNCRLLEKPEELADLVFHFTKSLSQMEYKLEKRKNLEENDCCFTLGKSNPSVKVSKTNEGLSQLWQQQLCQFNTVGLETAQAIIYRYNSPSALIAEYEKCESSVDGELLLKDIQIRRTAGIFSSSRKVGPQLSKKIYKFFTSDDPELEL